MVAAMLSPGESLAQLVLGIAGFFTAVGVISSPMRKFHAIRTTTHEVGQTDPYSYLAVLCNSAMWVIFGIPAIVHFFRVHHHHPLADYLGLPLMFANCYGIAAELAYVIIYIRYAVGQRRRPAVVLGIVVVFSVVVVILLETTGWSRTFVGILAAVTGVAMYGIPIYSTYAAYKANDLDGIPSGQACASFANGAVWTAYGCIGHIRGIIFVPNLVGVICAGGQLIARAFLKRKIAKLARAQRRVELAEAQRKAEEDRAPQDLESGGGNGGGGAGHGGDGGVPVPGEVLHDLESGPSVEGDQNRAEVQAVEKEAPGGGGNDKKLENQGGGNNEYDDDYDLENQAQGHKGGGHDDDGTAAELGEDKAEADVVG